MAKMCSGRKCGCRIESVFKTDDPGKRKAGFEELLVRVIIKSERSGPGHRQ